MLQQYGIMSTVEGRKKTTRTTTEVFMKTYYISVTKTLNKIVEVQANDDYEAIHKVADAYYDDLLDFERDTRVDAQFEDATEETINNYDLCGMPKFYEVK